MVKVIKRDGVKEDFDQNKIIKVLVAAGLNSDDAKKVSETVGEWLKTTGKEELKSTEIGDKVAEELKKVNTYVAGLFTWYEETKITVVEETDSKSS